jgi:hypothetical protein
MDIYSTLGYIFSPTAPETENHKECKQCGAFHNKPYDFCSCECEDLYEWNLEHPDTETEGCDRYHAEKDAELEFDNN